MGATYENRKADNTAQGKVSWLTHLEGTRYQPFCERTRQLGLAVTRAKPSKRRRR